MNKSNKSTIIIRILSALLVLVVISCALSISIKTVMGQQSIFGYYFGSNVPGQPQPSTSTSNSPIKNATSAFLIRGTLISSLNPVGKNGPKTEMTAAPEVAPKTNLNIPTLLGPVYVEHQKLTSVTNVNSSGEIPGIQWSYKGNGLIMGTNAATDSGQFLITFGPPGTGLYKSPVYIRGEGVIRSTDGQRANYIFQSIGRVDKFGTTTHNGVIVFITAPSIGKLASLNIPSNVGVFKATINKSGEGTFTVWRWQ